MMGGEYVGDWSCPNCHATVFASKNNCYKCQTPKPARAAAAEAGGGGGGYRRRPAAEAAWLSRIRAAAAEAGGGGGVVVPEEESQRARSQRRRARWSWTLLIKACVRRLHLQLLQRYLKRQDAIGKGLYDNKFGLLQVKDLEPGPMPADPASDGASEGAGEEALVEAPGPTQTSPNMTGQLLTKSKVAHETMVAVGDIFSNWVFHQKPPVGILPMIEQWEAFASDLLRLRREHNVTTEEGQQVTGEARFTLVSWNIQGLGGDEPLNEVILRTEVAMRELLALAPTIICLQEVVPETVETIEGMLGGRYLDVECFDLETVVTWTVRGLVEAHVEAHGHYFTKMFVSQRAIFANGLTVNAVSRFRFPSQQGRDLLLVTLEHKGKRMCVATTHLESGRDRISVDLRHRQLQYSLQKFDAHSVQRTQDLFLLVGDMNLGHIDNSALERGYLTALQESSKIKTEYQEYRQQMQARMRAGMAGNHNWSPDMDTAASRTDNRNPSANTAASESESTDEDDAALEDEAKAFFQAPGLSIREITHGWVDADLRPTWDAGSNKRVLKMLDFKDDEQMRPRDPTNKKKNNRFDRCYFKIRGFLTSEEATAAKLAWKFCGASLVGTNPNSLLEQSDHKLTRSGYVSDHYGLILKWEVSEKHMENEKKLLEKQEKRLAREKRRLEKIKETLEMKAKALKDAERKKFLQNCALCI
jgi:hypothetical protein